MMVSSDQLKDKIKNLSRQLNTEPQLLLQTYMMERFLERIARSAYREKFILKGGMLLAAQFGQDNRKTVDIDMTLKQFSIENGSFEGKIKEIISVDIKDNVNFEFKKIQKIREEASYQGLRVSLIANFQGIRVPIKIDMTIGDRITPKAIEFKYPLMFEDRMLNICSYNIETILAEKIESILIRNVQNTRMKDFYDIHLILESNSKIDYKLLAEAYKNTAINRGTYSDLCKKTQEYLYAIKHSQYLKGLWDTYREKYIYAKNINFDDVSSRVCDIVKSIGQTKTKSNYMSR